MTYAHFRRESWHQRPDSWLHLVVPCHWGDRQCNKPSMGVDLGRELARERGILGQDVNNRWDQTKQIQHQKKHVKEINVYINEGADGTNLYLLNITNLPNKEVLGTHTPFRAQRQPGISHRDMLTGQGQVPHAPGSIPAWRAWIWLNPKLSNVVNPIMDHFRMVSTCFYRQFRVKWGCFSGFTWLYHHMTTFFLRVWQLKTCTVRMPQLRRDSTNKFSLQASEGCTLRAARLGWAVEQGENMDISSWDLKVPDFMTQKVAKNQVPRTKGITD